MILWYVVLPRFIRDYFFQDLVFRTTYIVWWGFLCLKCGAHLMDFRWINNTCQFTNRRTFYPLDRFNSHSARVLRVISGRLEARRSRFVDQIVSTCRRCRSGFPSTRANANSIVAGSKSYLSRIYPSRLSRTMCGGEETQSPPGLMPSGANKV